MFENKSVSQVLDEKKMESQVKKSLGVLFPDSNSAGDFDVSISKDENGLIVIPRIGSSVAVTNDFYFKMLKVLEVSLYPSVQMQHPLTMQLIHIKDSNDWRKARAFFYPWLIGASQRLVCSSEYLVDYALKNRSFKLMSNISIPLDKNLILNGQTNSGKSFLLRQLLDVYSAVGEQVILIDGKLSDGARWAKIKGRSNVRTIIPELREGSTGASIGNELLDKVNDVLDEVETIMYSRQKLLYEQDFISGDYRSVGLKPIYLVIDELGTLTVGASKSSKQMFFDRLTRLSLLGRESGVVLVLSLQQARNDELPVVVRSQMGIKILLGPADKDNAQFLFPNLSELPFRPVDGVGTGIMSISGSRRYKGIIPIATPTIKHIGNMSR